MKAIKKSIELNATPEKVWEVLTKDENTRKWYESFSPGSHADTDWKKGSKAIFKDHSGSGIIGFIVESELGKLLAIEYTGNLIKGLEDYDSDAAKALKGARETYTLTAANGKTKLNIELDMGSMDSGIFDYMMGTWDKALVVIKQLAEN